MLSNTTRPGSLERAIAIAAAAHAGATDKAGAPYILHPLRVMLNQTEDRARIVGVLHDVVEDSADWSFERLLAEGFDSEVIEALRSVTKTSDDENQSDDSPAEQRARYFCFVRRAAANPIGRLVKLADLNDNLDESRLGEISDKDLVRMSKYRAALELLRSV